MSMVRSLVKSFTQRAARALCFCGGFAFGLLHDSTVLPNLFLYSVIMCGSSA